MKVVWICQFSNQKVRNKLRLTNYFFENLTRKLLLKRRIKYEDFSPWISVWLAEFEKVSNIELHIIAPHKGLFPRTQEFKINNINYHFFRFESFLRLDYIINKVKKNQIYKKNRQVISMIIKNINPDLINLIGAESPYYSTSALDVKNIPVLVSLQTVLDTPAGKKVEYKVDPYRIQVEKEIFQKHIYYGTGVRLYADCVKTINPDAIIFYLKFPRKKPLIFCDILKNFDFVFFAAYVTEIKGIFDVISALFIAKKKYPKVTLNVIGHLTKENKKIIDKQVKEQSLQKNIVFNDYFPSHDDMFKQIQKAKFAILPSKIDFISSTITEAMFMNLPVIAYETSGTPSLNRDKETILLAKISDISQLAKHMESLLSDQELGNRIKKNAFNLANETFDSYKLAKKLKSDYYHIINHFYNNKEIPEATLLENNKLDTL